MDFELKLQCWVGNAGMAECPAHGVRILNFQQGVHALQVCRHRDSGLQARIARIHRSRRAAVIVMASSRLSIHVNHVVRDAGSTPGRGGQSGDHLEQQLGRQHQQQQSEQFAQ